MQWASDDPRLGPVSSTGHRRGAAKRASERASEGAAERASNRAAKPGDTGRVLLRSFRNGLASQLDEGAAGDEEHDSDEDFEAE